MKGLSGIRSKLNKQLLTLTLGAGNLNVDETESLGTKARIKKKLQNSTQQMSNQDAKATERRERINSGDGKGWG